MPPKSSMLFFGRKEATMAKAKKVADPFGLSLMDVLSNALGGMILLLLIVAASIKSNESQKKVRKDETEPGAGGSIATLSFVESKNTPKYDYILYHYTLKITGTNKDSVILELRGDAKHISLARGEGENKNIWHVIWGVEGEQNKEKHLWQVVCQNPAIAKGCSISPLFLQNNFPIHLNKHTKLFNGKAILEVEEIENDDPLIHFLETNIANSQ